MKVPLADQVLYNLEQYYIENALRKDVFNEKEN